MDNAHIIFFSVEEYARQTLTGPVLGYIHDGGRMGPVLDYIHDGGREVFTG